MTQSNNLATPPKGFLTQDEKGAWFLCKEPFVKSCCLKKSEALPLEGDLKAYRLDQPVTLSGIYVEGKFQVRTVKQESLAFPYVTVATLLAACIAVTLYKLLKASSSSLKR